MLRYAERPSLVLMALYQKNFVTVAFLTVLQKTVKISTYKMPQAFLVKQYLRQNKKSITKFNLTNRIFYF